MPGSRTQLSARLRAAVQRLASDGRGSVAVLFALGVPVVAGAAAFGVETGYVYFDQYRLQNTADNAAYAAALDARAGGTQQTMSAAALEAAMLAYAGFFYAPAAHASVLMPGTLPLSTALVALLKHVRRRAA